MKQCQILTIKAQLKAWALLELKTANDNGCTSIEHPGPRWSGYVHKLRKAGIVVETIREKHGGPFSGQHARHLLRSVRRFVLRGQMCCGAGLLRAELRAATTREHFSAWLHPHTGRPSVTMRVYTKRFVTEGRTQTLAS